MASFAKRVKEKMISILAIALCLAFTGFSLNGCTKSNSSTDKSSAQTVLSSGTWKQNYETADDLFRKGKYIEEIRLLKSTLAQAQADDPHSFAYGKYLLRLSKAYTFARKYSSGKQYSLQALTIFTNLPPSEKISKDWLYDTNYYAGICLKNLHDESSALIYLNKAVDLSRDSSVQTGDSIDYLYTAIEKIYRNQKNMDKANAVRQERKRRQFR